MSVETHYLAAFTSDKTGPKWRAWRAMSEAQQAETARLGVAGSCAPTATKRRPACSRTTRT